MSFDLISSKYKISYVRKCLFSCRTYMRMYDVELVIHQLLIKSHNILVWLRMMIDFGVYLIELVYLNNQHRVYYKI
jgi:hypothetical protein